MPSSSATLWQKLFTRHVRLWSSLGLGILVFLCLPSAWAAISRVLIAWDLSVIVFLGLVIHWMLHLSADAICTRFVEEDESAPVILVIVLVAAIASLAAIVMLLSSSKYVGQSQELLHTLLAFATLTASWFLVPTMFTVHYADMFYSAPARKRPLNIPDTAKPVFWDFLYFSFTISAACQTADISTNSADIRRMVLAHTLISFLFNAAIVGFAINVTAGLIGSN